MIETEGTLPNSFFLNKATDTLTHKPHKNATNKENYRLISLIDPEILNKSNSVKFNYFKKIIHRGQVGFIMEM